MLTRAFSRPACALALALAAPAAAADVVPVFNASLSAGQYLFQGDRGSFSGNVSSWPRR